MSKGVTNGIGVEVHGQPLIGWFGWSAGATLLRGAPSFFVYIKVKVREAARCVSRQPKYCANAHHV
jgi:hypothetical protein